MASWAGLPYLNGMPRPLLIPVLVLLVILIVLGWWWPNRPQLAGLAMPAARLNSVSFAPFRDGQSPLTGRFPTAAQVEADVALVAARTRAIRTYASIEGEYDIPALAERHGLKVWLGIWLGSDRASNTLEIARGIQLAHLHPNTVERVVVGNEVLLRRDLPPAELTAALDQVRAAVPQPVTYADVWEFWEQYPEVAAHVDIVTIHLLPYWEDEPTGIEGAVAHVGATHRRIAARFPGKPVAIGETGWPSRGRTRGPAARRSAASTRRWSWRRWPRAGCRGCPAGRPAPALARLRPRLGAAGAGLDRLGSPVFARCADPAAGAGRATRPPGGWRPGPWRTMPSARRSAMPPSAASPGPIAGCAAGTAWARAMRNCWAVAGAWLGWEALPQVVLLAALIGLALAGGIALRRGGLDPAAPLPFGPCLACALWLDWLRAMAG